MFPRRFFPARYFAPRYWGEGGAVVPPVVPTGSKGRRLVRWVINSPPIPNPLGEYVWRREEEDEFYIVFG